MTMDTSLILSCIFFALVALLKSYLFTVQTIFQNSASKDLSVSLLDSLHFILLGGFAEELPCKKSARIQPEKTFLFLSWILFALLALLLGHLAESERIKVNPRVKPKYEVSFSRKSSKQFQFRKSFLTNHQHLSVLAKVFAKIIIFFWKNNKYLQAASLICSRLTQIFAKTEMFAWNFAKIYLNLMSSKYFHINSHFASHVATFCLFVTDLRNSLHFVDFRKQLSRKCENNFRTCENENFRFNPS